MLYDVTITQSSFDGKEVRKIGTFISIDGATLLKILDIYGKAPLEIRVNGYEILKMEVENGRP